MKCILEVDDLGAINIAGRARGLRTGLEALASEEN